MNLSQATSRSTCGRSVGLRHLWRDGAAAVVDRVERFLDVQRPRLAVAVEAIPIEEAERRVAGLLDLGDHQSVAERVDRAGFEEDAIADARLELMETVVAGAGGELAFELRAIDARLETGVDFAARFGGEHDPGFGLAEIGRRETGCLARRSDGPARKASVGRRGI